MKRILPVLLFAAVAVEAGTPLPAQILHGLIRDAYGFPYVDSARVSASTGTVECARYNVNGILPGGGNYRLTLDLDSGGAPYAPHAVKQGDVLTLAVRVGGETLPLMPTNRLAAGAPGSTLRLDLCTGTDSDGDGLPDEWEWLLCEQSGGRLKGLEDVRPHDDFDGDGLTNLQEFQACTFAFLHTDVFQVGDFEKLPGNRFRVRFLTSLGVTYRLAVTPSLTAPSWVPARFALNEGESLSYRELVGDGHYRTVIVEALSGTMFVRLFTQTP